MKLTCVHCGHTCISYLLNKEEALANVSKDFASHLESHPTSHQEWLSDINSINMIVIWLLMISKHTTIVSLPPEQTINDPVKVQFDSVVEKVMEILGIEGVDLDESEGMIINPITKHKFTQHIKRKKKVIQMAVSEPTKPETEIKPEESIELPSIDLPPSA